MSTDTLPSQTQQQTPAPAPQPRAPLIAAGQRGVSFTSLEDMFRFAKYVSASGLAPKGMEKPESILVALQMGAELGLTPMAALQNIAVINGRPSVWGDAMLAICRGSGMFDESQFKEAWFDEQGKELPAHQRSKAASATCRVRRLPHGQVIEWGFSIDDAKKAGLWGKAGPWAQYPQRMLQMRSRSLALRDAFTDLLRGVLSSEECEGVPANVAKVTTIDALTERLTHRGPAQPAEDQPFDEPLPAPETFSQTADEQQAEDASLLDGAIDSFAKCKTTADANDLHAVYAERPLSSEQHMRLDGMRDAALERVSQPAKAGKQSQKSLV